MSPSKHRACRTFFGKHVQSVDFRHSVGRRAQA